MASQPATQGSPRPRATTAACDVAPPRLVRIPLEWSIPWTSSGEGSWRTRTTGFPRRPGPSARAGGGGGGPGAAPALPPAGGRRGGGGGEEGAARGRPGRGVEPLREELPRAVRLLLRRVVE